MPRVVAGEDLVHVTSRPIGMAAAGAAPAPRVRVMAARGRATGARMAMADTVVVAAMAGQSRQVQVAGSGDRCSRRTGLPDADQTPERHVPNADLKASVRPGGRLCPMCICDRGYVDTIRNLRFLAVILRHRHPRGPTKRHLKGTS
jgi:hypothetical protein